jgi:hypothetical protein
MPSPAMVKILVWYIKQSGRQQIKIPILHNGFHTMISQNDNALLFKIKMQFGVFESSRAITANGPRL